MAGDFWAGFSKIFSRSRPPKPPRSPGPAVHINFHENSAPQTTSNAMSRQTAFRSPEKTLKLKFASKFPAGLQLRIGGRFRPYAGGSIYPRSLNSASPKLGNKRASGAGREGLSGPTFVWFFTARRAQTLAAPRRGKGLSPPSCKEPRESRPREPLPASPGKL